MSSGQIALCLAVVLAAAIFCRELGCISEGSYCFTFFGVLAGFSVFGLHFALG
jgi:hypothetical protein